MILRVKTLDSQFCMYLMCLVSLFCHIKIAQSRQLDESIGMGKQMSDRSDVRPAAYDLNLEECVKGEIDDGAFGVIRRNIVRCIDSHIFDFSLIPSGKGAARGTVIKQLD